jgi:hypothetical protein
MRRLKKELWPHQVVIDIDESRSQIIEIEKWLGSTMGIFKGRWNVVYQFSRTDFYFKSGRDATMFSLRWS